MSHCTAEGIEVQRDWWLAKGHTAPNARAWTPNPRSQVQGGKGRNTPQRKHKPLWAINKTVGDKVPKRYVQMTRVNCTQRTTLIV